MSVSMAEPLKNSLQILIKESLAIRRIVLCGGASFMASWQLGKK